MFKSLMTILSRKKTTEVKDSSVIKYSMAEYLNVPFVENTKKCSETKRVVSTRKDCKCSICGKVIPKSSLAVYTKAVVNDKWIYEHACLSCLNKELDRKAK